MGSGRKNIAYILPNLFTSASIFTGFISISKSIAGDFSSAAWLIFLSLVFDGLDGRVARLTNTSSKFGMEYDSLADIVAFGVAPAILLYLYAGIHYGRYGVLVSALFIIFGAVRLARFNITTMQSDPSVFIGLPIPTAAVFIASLVLSMPQGSGSGVAGAILLSGSLVVAILMVSNIRYPSFKKIDIERPSMLKTLIVITIVASIIYLYDSAAIAIVLGIYIIYGLIRATTLYMRRRR